MTDFICEKLSELAGGGAGSDSCSDAASDYSDWEPFVSNMKNYIEGYVSFPLVSDCGITTIAKVKKLCDGYNVRVYIYNNIDNIAELYDYDNNDHEMFIEALDTDSRCAEFKFQFNTQRLFIGVNDGCECGNDDNCANRFTNCCVGPLTNKQLEEYSQTSLSYKDKHSIGTSILAHLHDDIYVVINGSGYIKIYNYQEDLTDISRRLNSDMFLFHPRSEIVGYCAHVYSGSGFYPYVVDANYNYYLTIHYGDYNLITSLNKEIICDPYDVIDDEAYKRKRGIENTGKYSFSNFEKDKIFDHHSARVRDVWGFISEDSTVTEIIDGLGPKSAMKTC